VPEQLGDTPCDSERPWQKQTGVAADRNLPDSQQQADEHDRAKSDKLFQGV
jgi:hypothetical protein